MSVTLSNRILFEKLKASRSVYKLHTLLEDPQFVTLHTNV